VELYTIGHSVLSFEDFSARLRAASVRGLADVRRFPVSRRHPQFNGGALERALPEQGIEYRWFEALGGRREAGKTKDSSSNTGLQVDGFRRYADYALTEPFRRALEELLGWAVEKRVAICCAEALWWQCHRRIIADHLVARGHVIHHILGEGKVVSHELWDLARLTAEGPTYPPQQPEIFG
jgi:uncharacterized protein (DUF488 family)